MRTLDANNLREMLTGTFDTVDITPRGPLYWSICELIYTQTSHSMEEARGQLEVLTRESFHRIPIEVGWLSIAARNMAANTFRVRITIDEYMPVGKLGAAWAMFAPLLDQPRSRLLNTIAQRWWMSGEVTIDEDQANALAANGLLPPQSDMGFLVTVQAVIRRDVQPSPDAVAEWLQEVLTESGASPCWTDEDTWLWGVRGLEVAEIDINNSDLDPDDWYISE